jgi:hypothetical protein
VFAIMNSMEAWSHYPTIPFDDPIIDIVEHPPAPLHREVWMEIELESHAVDRERSRWPDEILYGCSDDARSLEDMVWATSGRSRLQVQLPGGCPDGDFTETSYLGHSIEGWTAGQKVTVIGWMSQSGSFNATAAYGGSMVTYWILSVAQLLLSGILLLSSVVLFFGTFWSILMASRLRKSWRELAEAKGLRFKKAPLWILGSIQGTWRGHAIRIGRADTFGDGSAMACNVKLQFFLRPRFQHLEMSSRSQISGWVRTLGSNQAHLELDQFLTTSGLAPARWQVLENDLEVRRCFSLYHHHKVEIEAIDGVMALSWSGLETPAIDTVLEHSIELLDRLEGLDSAGWQGVAEAHEAQVEISPEGHWLLSPKNAPFPWTLQFHSQPNAWRTAFELELPSPVEAHWIIQPLGGSSKGQSTGNPIVDSSLLLEGMDPELLTRLGQDTEATELLMSCMLGLSMSVENQRIRFLVDTLVIDPSEHIEQAIRLALFLIGEPFQDPSDQPADPSSSGQH